MKNSKILLTNCSIFIDNKFKPGIVSINDGVIEDIIFENTFDPERYSSYEKIDCEGGFLSYGFIDPHIHFRTPGSEHKEDWKTGSRAAVKGGFTYVIDMPNNNPSAVNYEVLKLKNKIASRDSIVNFGFHIGLTSENSSDINSIIDECRKNNINICGIKAFLGSSTGNLLVKDSESLINAFSSDEIILFHAENEDDIVNKPNFKDIKEHEENRPSIAEKNAIIKIKDAFLKSEKKAGVYICHLSSFDGLSEGLKLKEAGCQVYLEITPHHVYFTIDETDKSALFKINPPIRNLHDADKLRKAFNEGILSCVGTDHAPHLLSEKKSDNPPSGFPGLETAFYALSVLAEKNFFSMEKVFEMLTSAYEIFNIEKRGKIKSGNYADLTLVKKKDFIFTAGNSETKADFSPYDNLKSSYTIDTVLINGKIVLKNNKIIGE